MLLSSCVSVQVPSISPCKVAGKLIAGGFCANDQTGASWDLTEDQVIDMLEDQPERPDPDHPGQTLPARAGAVFMTADDFTKTLTSIEQLCRAMGDHCTYADKQVIKNLRDFKERHL